MNNFFDYVKSKNCFYKKLLDEGYLSIGCEWCTGIIKIGEEIRVGCWWWENDEYKECGFNLNEEIKLII
jgi:3''-phosphoadenosine 5''-phosphosulfate sulfotransferase (PAPS reductase)/FAD synthetase and related enzymes